MDHSVRCSQRGLGHDLPQCDVLGGHDLHYHWVRLLLIVCCTGGAVGDGDVVEMLFFVMVVITLMSASAAESCRTLLPHSCFDDNEIHPS